MAIHTFICDECERSVTDTSADKAHPCPKCRKNMRWDMNGNWAPKGDYCHISDSLAIHPDQIPEHNVKFPDIKVHPDGRPEFNSVKQQSDYLDAIGFVKHSQKIRKEQTDASECSNKIEHTFVCECGHRTTDTNTRGTHVCDKCGADMAWEHNIAVRVK